MSREAKFDLSKILRTQLLPWAQDNPAARFIIARSQMNAAQMPAGVQLQPRKIPGKRVIIKNRRYYNNTRRVAALWPAAGLNEVHQLKLACVLSGHIDYQIGHHRLQCGPGHFIFIPPGLPHPDGSRSYVDTEKSTSCELLFFMAHSNAIEFWLSHYDEAGRAQGGIFLVLHDDHLVQLFHMMMKEVLEGDAASLGLGAALLPAFLLALQREMESGSLQLFSPEDSSQTPPEIDGDHEADFATRLRHILQVNLKKSLTLESVAREMYLSRAQFARLVRSETGATFHELLAAERIAEAKHLLTTSSWTVAVIGWLVGLKSPSYFRTFFRKHTGQTPTEFRAEATGQNPTRKKRRILTQ